MTVVKIMTTCCGADKGEC